MITLHSGGVVWQKGAPVPAPVASLKDREKTIAYQIFRSHNQREEEGQLHLKFDSLISHDITYVGIIQTAKASGLKEFPVPYVMTNCHNSLCAVGGTINEDDHVFGLSAAMKYGGNFVPANQAVIHQYAREMMSGCGRMILGSDSHTRYGAIGTMGVGEGGPEIVKQLLKNTYDIASPQVVLVYLTGEPAQGVGPHDVAIALCGEVYKNGFVKNKVLEFAGPGIKNLPMDYRIGIDVMTTETACLSSIWETDEAVEEYLAIHGRPETYTALHPQEGAYYDSMITIDLSKVEPMAALPFHPSEAFPIRELIKNPGDILRDVELRAAEQFGGKVSLSLTDKLVDGKIMVDQGVIAGCAGGMYDNIAEAAAILQGHDVGSGYFSLSIYPPSVPVNLELIRNGVQQSLLEAGALFKPCFCGPCFGAGDVPANNGLSIRHTTRNFPNREGSKPGDGQLSGVVLMDARSIAATARNHGVLTPATEVSYVQPKQGKRTFDSNVYDRRVYFGFGEPKPDYALKFGPNIAEWPEIPALADNMLMQVASVLRDPVTTTDELIPSGETSSYRSNPMKLASFALSRRDPDYVPRALATQEMETARQAGTMTPEVKSALDKLGLGQDDLASMQLGSVIFANKPGDGSAREQAASCQRVLGGCANICYEFATKRYRSNCVNWGMLPFTLDANDQFTCQPGDFIYVPQVKEKVLNGDDTFPAKAVTAEGVKDLTLYLKNTTAEERELLLTGCLMNHYAAQNKA
ncbi:MAG: hydratase [Evtepia sp.]|uniref:hydratase n=1 Tax=Evtepia sp. TaxID=2773933 RepID=UPI002A7574E1|nr:hydratase [Evtepia sp.]MDY3013711.1 hydratase [Evtepia sp.]